MRVNFHTEFLFTNDSNVRQPRTLILYIYDIDIRWSLTLILSLIN